MAGTISVAMIVRDEADHIPECLDSLHAFADEICVVDTGSQDGSPQIARRHGARVTSFDWCDDFAAARNESLRQCSMDWIFVLDADERLAPPDHNPIRELTAGPQDCAYRFMTRNYTDSQQVSEYHPVPSNDPLGRGFPGWYPSTKVRLFPNRPGAQFEGKVHELVHESLLRMGLHIVDADVPIHHYPLLRSPERIQQKREQYLALGRRKVAENPDNPQAYAELGRQYAEVGDHVEAARAFRESLRRQPSNAPVLKDLGAVLFLLGRLDEARRALEFAVQLDPNLPDAWRNLGVVHVRSKRWDEAATCFRRAIRLNPDWPDGPRYLDAALQHSEKP